LQRRRGIVGELVVTRRSFRFQGSGLVQRQREACVERASAGEGDVAVGGLPEERMAERDRRSLGVAGRDEQAGDGELVEGVGRVVGQDADQHAHVELAAADRDRLEHRARRRVDAPDPLADRHRDDVGDRLGMVPEGGDELFDEQWGAGTPFGDPIDGIDG
jgi:hypothetical protein